MFGKLIKPICKPKEKSEKPQQSHSVTPRMAMGISVSARVALMSVYSLLFVVGFLGNMCVIFVILRSKRLRKLISSILIANIAVADFSVCVISAPYYLSSLLIVHPENPGPERLDSVCKGFIFFAYSLGFCRILLLAIISMERFLAINHPYFYRIHCTVPLPNVPATLICCYPWIQATVTTSPASFINGWVKYVGKSGKLCGYNWADANLGFVVSLIVINFCIPLSIIVYTNFKVYLTSRRQRRSIATCFSISSRARPSMSNFGEETFAEKEDMQWKNRGQTKLSLNFCRNEADDLHESLRIDGSSLQKSRIHRSSFHERIKNLESRFADALLPSSSHLLSNEIVARNVSSSISELSLPTDTKIPGIANPEVPYIKKRLQFEGPTKGPVRSNADDSGFRDESNSSSEAVSQSRKESKRSSIFQNNEGVVAARQFLNRLAEFPRRQTISNAKSFKYYSKANDFVVFFSTLSVVTLFLCTWLPFVAVTVVLLFSHSVISVEADLVVSMITVIDSAFTPVIVLGTRKEFRQVLLRKMCRLSAT